jgi:hypothetical protein
MKLEHAAVFMMLLAGPAAASEYIEFRSPTGNISCGLYSDGAESSVRCDMASLVPSYTAPPPDCEFDWGSSFAVSKTGKGVLACVSDPAASPDAVVLPYGEAISFGGISCVSAKTGMTCTNAEGHGFSISKAKQRLY